MNNNIANTNRGVLTTFYSTLHHKASKDEVDKIIIPLLQRDYAQGRPSANKIRARFLSALFNAIDKEDSLPIELDFIYGDFKEIDHSNVLYPLDGQQRLTTLFLIHWYVAKRIRTENVEFLESFSYQTRESSKLFCQKLLSLDPDFTIPIDDFIKDRKWYNQTWASDPTIASMLVVLRDINDHYWTFPIEQMKIVWRNLIGDEENHTLGKIRFYRLYINDMGMSDNLYIKMNSRGKPLTDFEHFKAELGKYTKEHKDFIFKVDTTWTNLLWAYRNQENDDNKDHYEDNGLDSMFLKLIRAYLIVTGVKDGLFEFKDVEKLDDFELLNIVFGSDKANEYICRFTSIMDFFAKCAEDLGGINNFFNVFMTSETNCPEDKIYLYGGDSNTTTDLINNVCRNRLTYTNLILISAFFDCALQYNGKDLYDWKDEFMDRLRIIRNLMVNSTDQIRPETLPEILRRTTKIVEKCDIDCNSVDYTKSQKIHEQQKLDWIGNDVVRKRAIYSIENHHLLYGNIKVLEIDGKYEIGNMRKFIKLFNYKEKMDLIERALLTIDDYGNEINHMVSYGGREFSCNGEWRSSVFVNSNKAMPRILKDLLDELNTCDEDELNALVNKYIEKCNREKHYPWRYYLVAYIGMRYGERAKYYHEEGSRYEYEMMNKTSFRGYHWNPFLFSICKEINGCTMSGSGSIVLPDAKSELACKEGRYILTVSGDNYSIPIPQDEKGIDVVDRINMISNDLTDYLARLSSKTTSNKINLIEHIGKPNLNLKMQTRTISMFSSL